MATTYAIARFVELEVAVSIFLVEVALFFEHTDDFITVELPDRFAHHSVGQRFRFPLMPEIADDSE